MTIKGPGPKPPIKQLEKAPKRTDGPVRGTDGPVRDSDGSVRVIHGPARGTVGPVNCRKCLSLQWSPLRLLDAAFLLTVGSFLLTVERFFLQLTISAFYLELELFLLTVGAFFACSGKVHLRRALGDCKQKSVTRGVHFRTPKQNKPRKDTHFFQVARCQPFKPPPNNSWTYDGQTPSAATFSHEF